MITILLKFQLLRYLLILLEYSSEIRIFAKTVRQEVVQVIVQHDV